MAGKVWVSLVLVVFAALGACAPAANVTRGETAASGATAASARKTLVVATHLEPTSLAPRPPTTMGGTPAAPTMMFSGWLIVADGRNVPRPQFAEKLAELNSADWQIFPDGQMETTFRLKPNLMWHDGVPITAEDVVLGFKVFTWSEMGVPSDPPIRLIQEVSAPDDRTVVIRWKQPYGEAGHLAGISGTGRYGGLPLLPRHLLEAKFRAGDAQSFLNDGYWTHQFVGSGPYRLDKWEPGAFIQASAVDGWVEDKAKIDQIKLVFVSDASAAVASLLAGDVHVAAEEAIGFEQGTVLKKQWESTGAGKVLMTPNKTRFLQVQFKPDYVTPRAVTDLRVRKAILQATDREALSGAILDGEVAVAHTIAGPTEEYFVELDRVGPRYPYSLPEAERLLADAGFRKGSDGFFADATGQRLSMELRAFAADPGPREAAILASQWKQFGLEANIHVIAAAQSQDLSQVSAYPALRIEQTGFNGTTHINKLAGFATATLENRWGGVNRGGWVNGEYDRLYNIFLTALDRGERNRAAIQTLIIAGEELPAIPLYYLSLAAAHTSDLEGLTGGYNNDSAWDNVAQWRWLR